MCRTCKISRMCNNLLIKDGFGHAQSQVPWNNPSCLEHTILKPLPNNSWGHKLHQPILCTKNSHKKEPKCCFLGVEDVFKLLVCKSILSIVHYLVKYAQAVLASCLLKQYVWPQMR